MGSRDRQIRILTGEQASVVLDRATANYPRQDFPPPLENDSP